MLYMKKGFRTEYDNKNYHKVRDHCHYTGIYWGSAHSICKLRYKTPKEIPVVFQRTTKTIWGSFWMARGK